MLQAAALRASTLARAIVTRPRGGGALELDDLPARPGVVTDDSDDSDDSDGRLTAASVEALTAREHRLR